MEQAETCEAHGHAVLIASVNHIVVSYRTARLCNEFNTALVSTPDQIAKLPQMPVRHTALCEKDAMDKAVLDAVK